MKKRVVLVGPIRGPSTFAKINRYWLSELRAQGLELHTASSLKSPRLQGADIAIFHDYKTRFSSVKRPDVKRFIVVRTWDFGIFPPAWVKKINTVVDELWVYSRSVREQAVKGGIDRRKVFVVPLGFDPACMQPPAHRPESKKTRFLFVGGANQRKGSDLLLEAFDAAFDSKDSVELVIKAHRSIFYPGSHKPKRRRGRAPVKYIDKHYSESDLAKLYQSASALVLPYRAEGFALPLLEAMACGTPVVAPRFGPALDFCSVKNSFLTRFTRVDLPVQNQLTYNALGHREYIDRATICEVSVDSLADELKKIHSLRRQTLHKKGVCAARDVVKSKTWAHSAKIILSRLEARN